jgi:glycosyltransferase 2 family protein
MEGTRAARPARVKVVSIAVATALAAALLYYSLRGIAWEQVGRTIANAAPGLLAVSTGMVTATLFLRALRWRILLNAEGSVGVSTAFWATAAGLFGNNFLPARAGELVRTFLVSSRSGLGNAYVLGTALSEKVADTMVLAFLSAFVLATFQAPPGWLAHAARPIAITGFAGGIVIAMLPLCDSIARRTIERAPFASAFGTRALGAARGVVQGLRAFHDLRRLLTFFGLTLLIWGLDAVGTMIGAAALGFRMPLTLALLLMAGLGLASALPSTPGYVGIYQFVAVTILTPFGFSRTDAIAYILVAQALMYVVIGFWGSLGLLYYRRTRRSA